MRAMTIVCPLCHGDREITVPVPDPLDQIARELEAERLRRTPGQRIVRSAKDKRGRD